MRRIVCFFLLGALAVLTLAPGARPMEAADNLLRNPSFEGQYSAWQPQYSTVQMAAEWLPWWVNDLNHNPIWVQPEYKRAEAYNYPTRVLDGQFAQQYFTFFKSHYAGIFQKVSGVTPGQRYRFSIWLQVWSSESAELPYSVNPSNPRLHIGIDPLGGGQAGPIGGLPASVVWSGEAPMDGVIDKWYQLNVEATAQNSTITVFVRSSPDFPIEHNDLYFDNAYLEAVTPPPPTPLPPTATPNAATLTASAPTATPLPTSTPEPPTSTPEPPTATPEPPTATPEPPTATPVPPTATPEPPTPTGAPPTEQAVAEAGTGADSAEPTAPPPTPVPIIAPPRNYSGLIVSGAGILVLIGSLLWARRR